MAATITISGGPLGDPGPILTRNLERMLTEATLLVERNVTRHTPIGVTEAARGSIDSEVRPGAGGIPVGVVGSPLKHVAVINDGRRPGARPPPVMEKGEGGGYTEEGSLVLWVRRKVSIRTPTGGSRAPTAEEARGVAYVIARSIGARGIEGRHFFERGIEDSRGALEQIFAAGGLRITVDLAGGRG
ncbi:MAG TPA: hypothetical protein VGC13_22300 [Longimicrobium sp.]|jgi:hypothetical protein|uniref:hypothetical protein n=1 Tax=Longimicrobium sp. TaxID=2029185 RepID=UPI002EDA3CF2